MVTGPFCSRCGAEFSPGASPAGLCPACLLGAALSGSGEESEPDFSLLQDGAEVGPFRIAGVLGKGGMATVYRAEDARLERTVALKVLPPEFLYDGTFARRFAQEARVVAKLEHPNIVPIYATGIDDGIPWMSMRLLAGGNLGALLEHRRLDPADAVRILRSVADALDYAHARGVVHRDVKPTNILLDDADRVCLGDFGLAQMLEGEQGVTRTGTLIGTPHYMAPEQALGQTADHRCDVYSLGIVAYEMFVGRPPFTGDSPMAVLLKHVNQPIPPPSDNCVSRAVLETMQKAVAKVPAERWSSAGAFVSALEAATGISAGVVNGPVNRVTKPRSVRLALGWAGASLGVLSIAVAVLGWINRERVSPEQPPLPLAFEQPWHPAPVLLSAPVEPRPAAPTAVVSTPATAAPRSSPASEPATPQLNPPPVDTTNTRPPVDVFLAPAAAVSTAPVDSPATGESPPDAVAPRAVEPDIITPPVLIRRSLPEYPAAARAAQLEGDVVLEAVVGSDGRVQDVRVLQSLHPLIDEAARNAVRKYEYSPGRRNGTPELARVRTTVSFKLR